MLAKRRWHTRNTTWTTYDGRQVPIRKMTTVHLVNAMAMVKTRLERLGPYCDDEALEQQRDFFQALEDERHHRCIRPEFTLAAPHPFLGPDGKYLIWSDCARKPIEPVGHPLNFTGHQQVAMLKCCMLHIMAFPCGNRLFASGKDKELQNLVLCGLMDRQPPASELAGLLKKDTALYTLTADGLKAARLLKLYFRYEAKDRKKGLL